MNIVMEMIIPILATLAAISILRKKCAYHVQLAAFRVKIATPVEFVGLVSPTAMIHKIVLNIVETGRNLLLNAMMETTITTMDVRKIAVSNQDIYAEVVLQILKIYAHTINPKSSLSLNQAKFENQQA